MRAPAPELLPQIPRNPGGKGKGAAAPPEWAATPDAAAEALGLSNTTVQNGIDSPRFRPYGCVWNRGRLQLNLNSGARQRGTAPDNTVKQICES